MYASRVMLHMFYQAPSIKPRKNTNELDNLALQSNDCFVFHFERSSVIQFMTINSQQIKFLIN